MFRMSLECFDLLCNIIENNVGAKKFMSEDYIKYNLHQQNSKEASCFKAHQQTSGGYVCGELKVATSLRLLAGASYLDIACMFNVNYMHVYKLFNDVLANWICQDFIYKYMLVDILKSEDKMFDIAQHFATGRNGGTLCGIIGALDGWLVKIKCPNLKQDGVVNPGGYFSRKGFYAINVQVIVDKKKHVLWRRIAARGSEHDSSAFKDSLLYNLLEEQFLNDDGLMHNNSFNNSFYLIGDSAYALRPWILTPYDGAKQESAEDTFNFLHSSCRIQVECTFGEIDARWGIFWRPLQFKLVQHKNIIDAAMRLHNFIVDFREKEKDTYDEDSIFQREQLLFTRSNPDAVVGVYGNGTVGTGERCGRPTTIEANLVNRAKSLRNSIRDKMDRVGLTRPRI